jgi:hypothetical protein
MFPSDVSSNFHDFPRTSLGSLSLEWFFTVSACRRDALGCSESAFLPVVLQFYWPEGLPDPVIIPEIKHSFRINMLCFICQVLSAC